MMTKGKLRRGIPFVLTGGIPMANRARAIKLEFRVSEKENDLIIEKMQTAGIHNREAYLRKMCLDGYVVRVDFSDVREMVRVLRNATNNLNQVAKRANETRSIYESDIKDLQDNYEKVWLAAEMILKKVANLPG